jgi:hypothetical protein
MWIFPLGASAVSGIFAAALMHQWWEKKRPNLLAWGLALLMFAIASFAAAVAMLGEWTPAWFRIYYLFGAIVNVPVLALGTIYLLGPRRLGNACTGVVVIASAVAGVAVFAAELEPGASQALATNGIPAGHSVMQSSVRMLARYYSFAGFFVVVGGALWSASRLTRQNVKHLRRLVEANLWIAAGTFAVALGSGFAFYGQGWPFAVGLLIGVTGMFWGFLKTRPQAAAERGHIALSSSASPPGPREPQATE